MNPSTPARGPALIIRKLAIAGGILLVALYLVAVGGGYFWLRYVRKNDEVSLRDVALFRLGAIRRGIAAQHFANAAKELKAKNYQAAYLYFSAGVRQDPANVPGRLAAVEFLRNIGAGSLALTMLEEGLALAPEERRLIEPTFDLLLATGRDRRALDLLKQRYGTERTGKNGPLLQRYEVAATLAGDGAPPAKKLLDRYDGLRRDPAAAPVVARVLWESAERKQAIDLLQAHVRSQPAVSAEYAQLARWQEAESQPAAAVQTARQACEKFPRELSSRVLLIEMLMAETPNGPAGSQAIAVYLHDFASQPESLSELAALAGRKGWAELNRALYQAGANRQADLKPLALSYCDALARESRFEEIRQILIQLEAQATEESAAFMGQLRQRQVIAAAALGDSESVRDYARRLAVLLNRNEDGLEMCRRLFRRLGIADAVAELTARAPVTPAPKTAAVRK